MRKLLVICFSFCIWAAMAVDCLALGDDITYSDSGGSGGGYSSSDSYYYDSYYYDSGGGGGISLGGLIGFGIIAFFALAGRSGNQANHQEQKKDLQPLPVEENSLEQLRRQDPEFSRSEIESMVKQWAMEFEVAWSEGDMTPHDDRIGKSLFQTYQSQLAMMRKNDEASRTEDMAVLNCQVSKWFLDGPNECLDVWLKVKKRTYKVSRRDPSLLVKGYRHTVYEVSYLWRLTRPVDKNLSERHWVLSKVDKLDQTTH